MSQSKQITITYRVESSRPRPEPPRRSPTEMAPIKMITRLAVPKPDRLLGAFADRIHVEDRAEHLAMQPVMCLPPIAPIGTSSAMSVMTVLAYSITAAMRAALISLMKSLAASGAPRTRRGADSMPRPKNRYVDGTGHPIPGTYDLKRYMDQTALKVWAYKRGRQRLPLHPRAGINIGWIVQLDTVRSDLVPVSPFPHSPDSIAGRAA